MSETMTKQEICIVWHYSLQDYTQLKILHELALKPINEIKNIVGYKGKIPKKHKAIRYVYDVEALQAECLINSSISEIAKKFKVPNSVVSRNKSELRVKGLKVPDSRFIYSEDVVKQAAAMRDRGCTFKEIKAVTGVGNETIYKYNKTPHTGTNSVESD